ncbi:hypothetical protein C2G38_2192483 [Gigaspora rosea]|uniref:CCHC-type domain-containing protein n=1 Tax=Gigaspora rosea TaxID=44941 RepID=A0A397V1W3_9GLOM|nr:hypothetical protein C2G38_2192483 [Gigaspora rosea]
MSVNNFNVQQTQNAIDKENIELSIKFKNPSKVAIRGRPKSASHSNQVLEIVHNRKKYEYNCKICKRPGHNAAMCPKGTDVTNTDDTKTDTAKYQEADFLGTGLDESSLIEYLEELFYKACDN